MIGRGQVVEGEMFGAPVPGSWPGGRQRKTDQAPQEELEEETLTTKRRFLERLGLLRHQHKG